MAFAFNLWLDQSTFERRSLFLLHSLPSGSDCWQHVLVLAPGNSFDYVSSPSFWVFFPHILALLTYTSLELTFAALLPGALPLTFKLPTSSPRPRQTDSHRAIRQLETLRAVDGGDHRASLVCFPHWGTPSLLTGNQHLETAVAYSGLGFSLVI